MDDFTIGLTIGCFIGGFIGMCVTALISVNKGEPHDAN